MTTYQDLIRDHYLEKRKRRPEFSLRAFAKQLGMTPGGISRLLNGKMNLSLARALEFALKLDLDEKATENFLNLVQLEKAKTSDVKEKILKKMERAHGEPIYELSVDHFRTISEWYPMAILKIASEPKKERTVSAMAKSLGISTAETMQAVSRLKRLGLLEDDQNGTYTRVSENEVTLEMKNDHEAVRKYYLEVLSKLQTNIANKEAKSRSIASRVLIFDEAQMQAVRALTYEYHEKLGDLSNQSIKKQKVYQALSSVFELTGKK